MIVEPQVMIWANSWLPHLHASALRTRAPKPSGGSCSLTPLILIG